MPISTKAIGAIAMTPVVFMFAGITLLDSIIPSGGTDLQSLYKQITAKDSYDDITNQSYLNWADVYMYDYMQNQNDFSNVDSSTIHQTDKLFIYYITEYKTVRRGNEYVQIAVQEPRAKSLLDVMTAHGYSMDEYNYALSIELALLGDSALPGGGDVTVPELRYKDIDPQILYNYVHARQSLFTLQDMKDMEAAAKTYDVNPALLLAITGQECSFDPVWIDHAEERHNNPWDVYVSYADYNTTFADAANIAANTIRNKLSTHPPKGEDAIQWINDPKNPYGAYAQDPQWAFGVEDIFSNIEAYIGTPTNAPVTSH